MTPIYHRQMLRLYSNKSVWIDTSYQSIYTNMIILLNPIQFDEPPRNIRTIILSALRGRITKKITKKINIRTGVKMSVCIPVAFILRIYKQFRLITTS